MKNFRKKVFSTCLVLLLFLLMSIGSSEAEVEKTSKSINDNVDETETNSRKNPAKQNETFTVKMSDWLVGNVTFEIELIETVSGDEAWDVIRKANQFNDRPEEGQEYIMAKFRVKILETEEDEAFELDYLSFGAVSGTGIEYDNWVIVSGVTPKLDRALYEGAEHEGWVFFIVDKNDEESVAVLERRLPAELWFSLRN